MIGLFFALTLEFAAQATNPTGTADQVLVIPHAGGLGKYGQVDLSQSAATKNQLPPSRGGTGQDFSGSTGFFYDTAGTVSAKTVTQTTALLNPFVGDSGSGGLQGLVPAPAAGDAAANKFLSANGSFATPAGVPGQVITTAATSCPSSTIAADGSSLLRAGTYASLFSAIGTTYGSVDGTHFTLPNMQGVFPRGAGSQTIAGISYTGTQGTTQGDELQGHIHSNTFAVSPSSHTHNVGQQTTTTLVIGGGGNVYAVTGSFNTSATSATSLSITGAVGDPSADAHSDGTPRTGSETRPAAVALLYCIYYQ